MSLQHDGMFMKRIPGLKSEINLHRDKNVETVA